MTRVTSEGPLPPLDPMPPPVASPPSSALAAERFQRALALHRDGRLAEAEAALDVVLAERPGDAAERYRLGIVQCELGRLDEGIATLTEAARAAPKNAEVHKNLGHALNLAGRPAEAERAIRRALALRPAFAEAHDAHGVALRGLGRLAEAHRAHARALALAPALASAHGNLGAVRAAEGDFTGAAISFRAALASNPGDLGLQINLAHALLEGGDDPGAIAIYGAVLACAPDASEALRGRGLALARLERAAAAAAPHVEAGARHFRAGALDAALECFDRARDLASAQPASHVWRGAVLRYRGELDAAEAAYAEALRVAPGDRSAEWHLGMLRLLRGDFARGWPAYERRHHIEAGLDARALAKPRFTGAEDIAGKTVLLRGEQGAGDTLQFVRYAACAMARGATVLVEADPTLAALVATVPGVHRVVATGTTLPGFDYRAALMSLPGAFGHDAASFPRAVPYVTASGEHAARWRARLGPRSRPRIGVVWSGNPAHLNDHNRSMPLATLEPLLADRSIDWFALQKDIRPLDAPVLGRQLHLTPLGDALADFSDTAGAIAALDAVVSVDTSVAHLAGALGKPVCVMLPFAPDWRWLLGREDTPWYPTMLLARQPSIGDWTPVIARVADWLATLPA